MKIVIAGAHGFIGKHLVPHLREGGHDVVCLTRQPNTGEPFWDPEKGQLDPSHVENVDVVINLCGESVIGRWSQGKMERIRKSRFAPTKLLCQTLLCHPPKLYIGASAIGYYGDRGNEKLTEESRSGHGYLAEVCRQWEEFASPLQQKGVRTAWLRFGIVLGNDGGALKKMLPPFKLGLGGIVGNGKQRVSWIAIDDVLFIVDHVITHDISGPINLVAPQSVSNRELTKALGEALHRPTPLPMPEFIVKLFFGSGSEVFLASADVVPDKLEKSGYRFHCPELKPWLDAHV